MATLALHFPLGEVTLAQRLRAMLATCDTKADFSAWCGDYLAHAHLIPLAEARQLVGDATIVGRKFGRA